MRVPFDCSGAKTIAAQHLRAVRATHGDALAARRARALAASLAYALMARRAVQPSQVAIGCRASSATRRVPLDCSCAKTIAAQHLRAARATPSAALAACASFSLCA